MKALSQILLGPNAIDSFVQLLKIGLFVYGTSKPRIMKFATNVYGLFTGILQEFGVYFFPLIMNRSFLVVKMDACECGKLKMVCNTWNANVFSVII